MYQRVEMGQFGTPAAASRAVRDGAAERVGRRAISLINCADRLRAQENYGSDTFFKRGRLGRAAPAIDSGADCASNLRIYLPLCVCICLFTLYGFNGTMERTQ